MKNIKLYLLSLLTLISIPTISCDRTKEDKNNITRSVILTSPETLGENISNEYSGTIEEGKSVNASFMADGKIARIMVKEGDRVKKGQLLAALDDADYQIGVNQLKAQYNQMTEEKKRLDEMYARHNVAPNDYEKFIAGYEQLSLQMDMAENKLSYTRLLSPSDGYVSEKFMEPGELIGAGTPIVKITDDSGLKANVDLPLSVFLDKDNISSTVGLTPVIPASEIPLKIESFTPDASNNMLYHMKLSIPSTFASRLTPGMNIRVKILTSNNAENGHLIPSRSIFTENGITMVWVYDSSDSTIHKKNVMPRGVPFDKKIAVTGLDGNEKIVETGVRQLFEGEKVHAVKNTDFSL